MKKNIVNVLAIAVPLLLTATLSIVGLINSMKLSESMITVCVGGWLGSLMPWLRRWATEWLIHDDAGIADLIGIIVLVIIVGIPTLSVEHADQINQYMGAEVVRITPPLLIGYVVAEWIVTVGIDARDQLIANKPVVN